MNLLPYIATRLFNTPLLIHPGKLHAIVAGLSDRFGVAAPPAPQAYTAQFGTREKGDYRLLDNGVAILEVFGILAHRGGLQADSSYIQGYDGLARALDGALRNPNVRAILLEIDSPGGEVSGAFQFADQVYAARRVKPIAAIAGDMAASAAYLIASAADSVSIVPTGMAGSIGVVTSHVDMSRAMDSMGLAVTYIYAGAHKIDGNPLEPLSQEVAADIQAAVDYYYDLFVGRVASYRPATDAAALKATEARVYIGEQALTARLVDRVETPDQAVARLAAQISTSTGAYRAQSTPMKLPTMEIFGFGKKRLNLDISVSADPDPDAEAKIDPEKEKPDESTPDEPETEPVQDASPPAPVALAALTALEIVQMCHAADEPGLAELALKTPHTREQLATKIKQAKAVRAICATAGAPELADGLILHGSTETDAMAATWNALVTRSEQNPVDATPPTHRETLSRAAFATLHPAKQREFIVAGGKVID
jgi:signal peptide peptidase SppA